MTKKLLCTAIAALAPLCSFIAHAAIKDSDLPVNNLNADTQLKAVVITASRVEEKVNDSLASVTVLERADIEALQAKDFRDLIAHVPGVDISTSGAPGSNTSLFLRGTNSAHTLVLIDGQRVASATTGTANLQFLDPSQIERIEVVRGPKSSLYGSDAIGGVIHIFTRKSPEQTNSAYASAGVGKYNSSQANVGGQTNYDQWRLSANLSHYETDGFSNYDSNLGNIGDDDAYRNTSASANIGYDFSDKTSLDFSHFYTDTRNEFDPSTSVSGRVLKPYTDGWIQSTSGTFKTEIFPIWKMSLAAGRSVDDGDTFKQTSNTAHSHVRTTHENASLQNDLTFSKEHVVTAGIDYDKDKVNSSNTFVESNGREIKDRDNKGIFLQYLGELNRFDTQLGVRHDDNDSFGMHNTGNAALGIALPEKHKIIFSYGTAFRAPTFNQLYYPGFGNPSLKPERSKNYEIELRGDYSAFNWSANIFQNDVTDLIQNVPIGGGLLQPENAAEARIRGVELISSAKISEWLVNASFTYTDPRDRETDNLLINRARRSVKVDADRVFDKWSLGASFRTQDERYSDAANTIRLGGYGLVDLRGGYNISKNLDLQLKLTNIFDKRYELNNNFNTERFGWFTTINYRM